MARILSLPHTWITAVLVTTTKLANGFFMDEMIPTSSSNSRRTEPPSVTQVKQLKIERGFVSPESAKTLYKDVLEAALPGPNDNFHPQLLGIYGDGGTKMVENNALSAEERVTRFSRMVNHHRLQGRSSDYSKESGILRIEHLKNLDYEKVDHLVNKVVDNKVLQEDGGTIHVYLSLPESAALANHTDVTDIFVLQLEGAKEWLLCEEPEPQDATILFPGMVDDVTNTNIQKKLDKCTTYNDFEIDRLVCQRHTLYPGDVLFLPKRVVHSARATTEGLSAHLTFGFADKQCPRQKDDAADTGVSVSRFLQSTTCNSAEGGTSCDASCDSNCNTSCDGNCNTGCTQCNSSCDDNCNTGCDSGCACVCVGCCSCGCNFGVCTSCCNCGCSGCCNSSCDSSCNSSCDSGCNGNCNSGCNTSCDASCSSSCDTSCDVCPSPPSPRPTPSPSQSPTSQPTQNPAPSPMETPKSGPNGSSSNDSGPNGSSPNGSSPTGSRGQSGSRFSSAQESSSGNSSSKTWRLVGITAAGLVLVAMCAALIVKYVSAKKGRGEEVVKSVDEASAPQLATPAAKSFDMTPIIAEEPTEEPTNTVADLPDEHAGTVVGLPDEREAGTTYFVDL